jgi:hypothetical protein
MIEKAYDQDKELNKSLFLLKEQVMKKISYKDLLGKDESEATNAEIQLAKDIYAYMLLAPRRGLAVWIGRETKITISSSKHRKE